MRPGRGRKPKPIGLRVLQGNPSKRPIPDDLPEVEQLYEVPEPPRYFELDEIAKEIWNDLAPKLTRTRILTDHDLNTLAHYCSASSICIMARKKIREETLIMTIKNDDGTLKYAQKSPFITVYREALDDVIRLGAQLGLSPSERARLHIKKDDEKEDFFKQGILLRQASRSKGN